jgi:hypothetical protein
MFEMSSPKKGLKDFLLNEIEKSGFPLEIEVTSILEKLNWVVLNNQPFRDPDEEQLRSVDIFAFQMSPHFLHDTLFGFTPRIIIECKKSSSHAWVFFTRPINENIFCMNAQVYDYPQSFSTQAYNQRAKIMKEGFFSLEYYFNYFFDVEKGSSDIHYCKFDRKAIAYQEYKISEWSELNSDENVSKRKSDPTAGRNEVLEAINQVVKFLEFDFDESVNSPGRIKDATSPLFPIELNFIAIVFDGKLFEAIIGKGKAVLEESKHILLHFVYRPKKSSKNLNYWIDVVNKDFFPEYMNQISKDITLIEAKIETNQKILSQYLLKDNAGDGIEVSK